MDSGPGITKPAWLRADSLQVGDTLRTASGKDVTIIALRYHVGTAHVYTLTVATDHDFFVGAARVLVHNSSLCPTIHYGPKILNQIAKRGWTKAEIQQTILYPADTAPAKDLRHIAGGGVMNDPATVYYRKDGNYVIRNNVTGDIVQVSDTHDPNWIDPTTNAKIHPR